MGGMGIIGGRGIGTSSGSEFWLKRRDGGGEEMGGWWMLLEELVMVAGA